jgi:hypothetical protein
VVTTRNVNRQASALAKARERRRELDKTRDDQDRRVEQATAMALVALDTRRDAERSLREATEGLADGLRRLVGQEVMALLKSLPVDPWMVTETTPLTDHPNDPASS